MPENDLLQASTPVLRRAADLLDGVCEVLADPSRWCTSAYARNAEGEPIEGTVLEAVESSEVASRCVFAELLHQGFARGYRLVLATTGDAEDQIANEVTRAPASWILAARALDRVAWSLNEECARRTDELLAKYPSRQPDSPGQRVLWLTTWNDTASYEEAITCVGLAVRLLRAELDRRAQT